MTEKQAIKVAVKRWGKNACVQFTNKGCFVGEHGEYVCPISVARKTTEHNREGHYRCRQCPEPAFHLPGEKRTRFTVGAVVMGLFFEVRGEGLSFEDAFKAADAFDNRFKKTDKAS